MKRGKDRRGEFDRRQRLVDRVLPAERLEVGVVQRLDPDRQPVDAGGAIAAEPLGFHAGRIGLERDLRVGRKPPDGCDGVDNALHRLRPHQRRRSPAEEDRGDRAARRKRAAMADLRPEGREIALLVDRRPPHVTVEVAIGTFRQAEGPMDVDPKSGVGVADGRLAFVGLGANAVPNHLLFMPAIAVPRQLPRGRRNPLRARRRLFRRCESAGRARSRRRRSCRRRSGRCGPPARPSRRPLRPGRR